jgi:hypothetical protein
MGHRARTEASATLMIVFVRERCEDGSNNGTLPMLHFATSARYSATRVAYSSYICSCEIALTRHAPKRTSTIDYSIKYDLYFYSYFYVFFNAIDSLIKQDQELCYDIFPFSVTLIKSFVMISLCPIII